MCKNRILNIVKFNTIKKSLGLLLSEFIVKFESQGCYQWKEHFGINIFQMTLS